MHVKLICFFFSCSQAFAIQSSTVFNSTIGSCSIHLKQAIVLKKNLTLYSYLKTKNFTC